MTGAYDDIINLPHHVSETRKRMSMIERAAQFSPFAALTGYDAAIRETGRLTDARIDLDVDGKAMLNEKIRILAERQMEQPEITITYFVPDERKQGGAYVDLTTRIRKIDRNKQVFLLEDGREVLFEDIYDICSDLFVEIGF